MKCHATLLTVLILVSSASHAESLDAARQQFRDALASAGPWQATATSTDSEALRSYPLYAYLEDARLELALRAAASGAGAAELAALDAAIEEFLGRHGAEPVARGLRRQWLESLAGRSMWEKYLQHYDADLDSAETLRCLALVGRSRLGRTEGLEQDIIAAWLSPKSMPDACDPAFEWMRERGRLTPQLVEQRARLALEAGETGLARYLARSLPESSAAPLLQWASLIEQPAASIDALIANPGRAVEPQALLAGWTRLARRDPDGAASRYPGLVEARKLDAAAASPYAIATGLGASWSRKPYALEFFARGQPQDFDEVAHEWHVRAALWSGDWARARSALEAMPQVLRDDNRWRYWAARSAEALGDREAARQGYAAVVPTDNWYAVLSSARLGQAFAPTLVPMDITATGMAAVEQVPGMVRARELRLCDMRDEAAREWRWTYEQLDPAQQLQAIGIASAWDWHLEAVAAAAKRGLFNDYERLYPHPYDSQVQRASGMTGLPPELIYAIIRQESLYRADAASSAGALGLMQLLPSTATRTARRWDLPAPSRSSLLLPEVNVPLGSATLKSLLDRADGQTPLAMGGYNAGPGAARRWLPDEPMDLDIWVENIPYNETRGYIQRASWHTVVFRWLREREPRPYDSWLGQIHRPGTGDALEPAG